MSNKQKYPKCSSNKKTDEDRFIDLSNFAKMNGFTLLDHEWMGSDVKHNFLHDSNKMTYSWLAHQVMGSQGFPKDLKSNEDRFKKLVDSSLRKGFKVVSERWLGPKTKHQFIHLKTGELYEGTPTSVMGSESFLTPQFEATPCSEMGLNHSRMLNENTKGFKLLEQQWMESFLLLGSTFSSSTMDYEESESLEMA